MFHDIFELKKKSPSKNKIQKTTDLIRTIAFSFNIIIIIEKGTRKLLLVLFDNNFIFPHH